MASCSENGSRGHHKFTLNVNETYVSDGVENYSTVSWSFVLSPVQIGWDWYWGTAPVNYRVNIAGTEYTGGIANYDGRSTITIDSGTINIPHNPDGSKLIEFFFEVWDTVTANYLPGYAYKNGNMWLTNIARYTNINSFTVSKRNETSVTCNFTTADICDYVWYSEDNGSKWTGVDITDGTTGSFNVSGLSANTTYNFKLRVRRKDSQLTTDSNTVSQTTYKVPSNTLNSKTETTIKVNWSVDSTADYIWYSKDNGSNWTVVGGVNATSGIYEITGLIANTAYNIKTRVRRKSSQTTYDTSTLAVTTYDYPYCTESPNFTIGTSNTLKFYNPLSRSIKIYIIGADNTEQGGDTITGTSISGYYNSDWKDWLYSTIPNTTSGKYKVKVVYGSISKIRDNGNTYSIVGNEIPTFNDFIYMDTNTSVVDVTGNNQVLVKGLSNLRVTISEDNKMRPNNSAVAKSYTAIIDNINKNVNYSTSDLNIDIGTVVNSGTKRLNVTAYDSRNLSKTVYKDITIYDYEKPVLNVDIARLNNFEETTTLKVNGSYTGISIDGNDKNTIMKVQYRFRETNGEWSNWVVLKTTVISGKFTCNDILLNLDNTKAFEFEVQVADKLQITTESQKIEIGKAIFFISSNKKDCYINGKKVLTESEIIDNLEDESIDKALSVKQGKILNNKINDITEIITNENGTAIKYADGTMICYIHIVRNDIPIQNKYGVLYTTNQQKWIYPVKFIDAPNVGCQEFHWGTGGSWGVITSTLTTSATYNGMDAFNRESGVTVEISLMAIGRWK